MLVFGWQYLTRNGEGDQVPTFYQLCLCVHLLYALGFSALNTAGSILYASGLHSSIQGLPGLEHMVTPQYLTGSFVDGVSPRASLSHLGSMKSETIVTFLSGQASLTRSTEHLATDLYCEPFMGPCAKHLQVPSHLFSSKSGRLGQGCSSVGRALVL